MPAHALELMLITLGAATINGALGYGFSSITVPIALLFMSNRTLNPALVMLEVPLNAWVLWVNRDALPHIWKRLLPMVVGLLPGIVVGTMLVSRVSPDWLKLVTYALILPVILFQAAGFRRPVQSERSIALGFGGGIGLLYSLTTISGPPLAMWLNNQGLAKREFRAALGFVRLAESLMTAIAYVSSGLFIRGSLALVLWIFPSVLIGVPIGARLMQASRPETFRRICMSFDAWIVGFGLSKLVHDLKIIPSNAAYFVLLAVMLCDGWLLYRFFAAASRVSGTRVAHS